jgi:homocysteine S-methyltransferase
MPPALGAVRNLWSGPLGAYPETGEWIPPNWVFGDLTPAAFAATALGWVRNDGVRIIGGCCGTRPDFIAALHDALASRS